MRFFIISIVIILQPGFAGHAFAASYSTIQALVPDWGQGDQQVHIADDQTSDYEKRYDVRDPIEKILAETAFRSLELFVVLLLLVIAHWLQTWYERRY